MTIGEDIYTTLSSDGTVAGLVSTRIYPMWIKQDATYPAITFLQITSTPQLSVVGPTGLTNYIFQFDCWDKSYSGVQTLSAAVIAAINGATLFRSNQNSAQDFFDPEYEVHRKSVDFSIWQ